MAVAAALLAALASCATGASPAASGSLTPGGYTGTITPDATSSPQPSPTDGTTVPVWQLRYRLLNHYADFAYCDPDYYPVARADEQSAADDWWSQAIRGSAEVVAILAHHGYREPLTTDQRLTAYRDHKKLAVIAMRATSSGYDYELSTSASGGGEPDQTVAGLISLDGTIHERERSPRPGGCPICLEADTRIATPSGDRPIAELKPGDVVWTVEGTTRVAAPVERVIRRATPGPHLMLRLALSDGRVLIAAGTHPTADGRYLRELRIGRRYDGATIASIGWVSSTAPATYDIRPAGSTAAYWANGILIRSTLRR